jgi:hypothetical protein
MALRVRLAPLHRLFEHGWYVDDYYATVLVAPGKAGSEAGHRGDDARDRIALRFEDRDGPQVRRHVFDRRRCELHGQYAPARMAPAGLHQREFGQGVAAESHRLGAQQEDKKIAALDCLAQFGVESSPGSEFVPIDERLMTLRQQSEPQAFDQVAVSSRNTK